MTFFDLAAWGFFAPKPMYWYDDIPDLSGKVAIITGANTGIGRETARVLLSKGAKVYAACRSEDKALVAINQLKKETGKEDIHYLKLDLGDIKQADSAAKQFLDKEKRLDILINSAGVMFPPPGSLTADGLELQFGTNVVGHYAFTTPLFPLLSSTAKANGPASVRVVWVSSSAHFLLCPRNGIDFESITNTKRVANMAHYGQSKLGDIHLSNETSKRLFDDGVLSVSLNPGNIRSQLQRHISAFERIAIYFLLHPVDKGAITQLYGATSPDLRMEDSGAFLAPWARKHKASHPKANDPQAIADTWQFCKDQVEKVLAK